MRTSRIIMIQGDAFDSTAIDGLTREGDTLFIYVRGREFEYEFDNEKIAQDKHSAFIQDWRAALSAYESEQAPAQD